MTTAAAPRVYVSMPNFGDWIGSLADLVAATARLEETAVHGVVVVDHVTLGPGLDSYPFGTFPTGPDEDWYDPLITLSAMAAVTRRLVLATGILIVPLRPATVVAKTVATLDVLSGGRVNLGVGAGWYSGEFDAAGIDFASRGERLEDTVAACRALWAGGAVTFSSSTVELEDVWCHPTPVQERLPVLFAGAMAGRNLRCILTHGDGWVPPPGADSASVITGTVNLHAAWDKAGRSGRPSVRTAWSLVRRVDGSIDVEESVDRARPFVEAGVTDLVVSGPALAHGGRVEDLMAAADALAVALQP